MKLDSFVSSKQFINVVSLNEAEIDIVRENFLSIIEKEQHLDQRSKLITCCCVEGRCTTPYEAIIFVKSLSSQEFLIRIAVRYLFNSDGSNLQEWGLGELHPPLLLFKAE